MFRLVMATLASLILASSIAAQTLRVRLEALPATTLPAIPVTLRMSFTSDGGTVRMPNGVSLVVTPADGSRSVLLFAGHTVAAISAKQRVGKRPVVIDFPTDGTFGEPGWFYGYFPPGIYDLQLYAGDYLSVLYEDVGPPLNSIVEQARAVSNVVTLTVAEPTGADAEIWKAMKAFTGTAGNFWLSGFRGTAGAALVQRAVRDYPDAAYTGWLATAGTEGDERYLLLREWLDGHPDDPYYENRMLRVAELETNLAIAYRRINPARSQWNEKVAREVLAKLRNARSAEIRERARDRLRRLDESHDR